MKKMKDFLSMIVQVLSQPFVKYAVISIFGITLVCFVGENSLMAHLRNKSYISKLSDEIEEYNERYNNDLRQIRELNHNPKAMERIARERYFMKQDDEDIFVLSDDSHEYQSTVDEHETAE
jgi:cell division protein FtsB